MFALRRHYLNILGLPETATKKEIKRAYRKKAMQYHPDKNQSENAQEMFIQITEAYDYLTTTPAQRVKQKEQPKTKSEQYKDDFYERMKRAKEVYEKRQQQERKVQLEKFKRFKESFVFKTSIPLTVLAYLLYFIMFLDTSLPSYKIESFVETVERSSRENSYTFITTKGAYEGSFANGRRPLYVKKGQSVTLHVTPILNDLYYAQLNYMESKNTKSVHYYSALIFVCLLFTLSGLIVRNPSFQSYLTIHLSYFIAILVIIYVLYKVL